MHQCNQWLRMFLGSCLDTGTLLQQPYRRGWRALVRSLFIPDTTLSYALARQWLLRFLLFLERRRALSYPQEFRTQQRTRKVSAQLLDVFVQSQWLLDHSSL